MRRKVVAKIYPRSGQQEAAAAHVQGPAEDAAPCAHKQVPWRVAEAWLLRGAIYSATMAQGMFMSGCALFYAALHIGHLQKGHLAARDQVARGSRKVRRATDRVWHGSADRRYIVMAMSVNPFT